MTEPKPGPDLDRLVAEKILGCKILKGACGCDDYSHREVLDRVVRGPGFPPYSTEIGSAWKIVEALIPQDIYGEITFEEGRFRARFLTPEWRVVPFETSESAALAICLAALKAKGVQL